MCRQLHAKAHFKPAGARDANAKCIEVPTDKDPDSVKRKNKYGSKMPRRIHKWTGYRGGRKERRKRRLFVSVQSGQTQQRHALKQSRRKGQGSRARGAVGLGIRTNWPIADASGSGLGEAGRIQTTRVLYFDFAGWVEATPKCTREHLPAFHFATAVSDCQLLVIECSEKT